MTKVLLTGFEPFAGSSLNPSQLIVEQLAGTPGLETVVLPVEYDSASAQIVSLVERIPNVQAILCLGQAEGRSALSFERVAVNLDDAMLADNGGVVRNDEPIDPSGPRELFSTLPIENMVSAVREVGVPAEISLSAGTFVCNHIFYTLQQLTAGTNIKSGFVHVPLVEAQAKEFRGKPTLPLQEMVLGIKTALTVVGL